MEYADGTTASVGQMAQDVAAFLTWAAEPAYEERKSLGVKVILFLLIFVVVLALAKRNIWRKVEH